MKETEKGINTSKDIPCSWVGRINIAKMSILSKVINRFNAIPKTPIVVFFFHRNRKKILEFKQNHKRPQTARVKKGA